MIFAQSEKQNIEKIESLPLTLSYEIAKEDCPELIRERVIDREIKTVKELKEAIKEIKKETKEEPEEVKEIVQEAEIVEEVGLEKFDLEKQIILNSLEAALEKIKNGANTPENLKKLLTAQGIIDSVK